MKCGMKCPELDEVCVLFVLTEAAGLRNSHEVGFEIENGKELLEVWQEGGL